MTTIAYRDGVIASDSRMTTGRGYVLSDTIQKLYKLSDGAVLGLGGHNHNGLVLLDHIKAAIKNSKKADVEKNLPSVKCKGVEALLVTPSKDIYVYDAGVWDILSDVFDEDYYALGSGSYQACAAMDQGADAVTAVKQGIRRDMHSGGRVQRYKVF